MASELDVFVLVVDSGSFASAARRLRLTPSAISRRIALLEDRVGVQLLSRTTRKVELTAAGEYFHSRIKPLLKEVSAATRDLQKFTPLPVGHLRVGAPAALLERKLISLVGRYLDSFPQMSFELVPNEMIADEGDLDINIQSSPSLNQEKTSIKLAENPWLICASPRYLEVHGTPTHPNDLLGHRCLALSTQRHWRFNVELEELTIAPPTRILSFGSAIYKAAVDGLGIAQLAAFLVNEDLRSGTLVQLLQEHSGFADRHLYLVCDGSKLALSKYATFAAFLKEAFTAGF